jgi:type I restriction enzyme S subunit
MNDESPEIHDPPDGWTLATVRSVVDLLQYGISTKADASAGTGVPILRMGNIQEGRLDVSELKYVARSRDLATVRLEPGDILFNRTNSPDLVGKAAVVDIDTEMVFASYLIRLRARANIVHPRYLCWWINSAWGREWAARVRTDGVSQSNINGTKLGEMPMPLAPVAEQARIVEAVAALLEQVNRARERLDRVPLILKRFRQAVLAAACSGNLTAEWRERHPTTRSAATELAPLPPLRQKREVVEVDLIDGLPPSWTTVPLGQAADVLDPNPSHRYPTYARGSIPLVATREFAGLSGWDLSMAPMVPESVWEEQNKALPQV